MNPRLITRLPWFELSLILVMAFIGWAVFALLQLEPADRLDFERVEQAATNWQATERSKLLNWQESESVNFLAQSNKIQKAFSDVQGQFTNELRGLEETQMTNDWTQPGIFRIHEEYLSIAAHLASSVPPMQTALSNYVGRSASPELAGADYGAFLKGSRDLRNWIAKKKDRPDAEWFQARSQELKERISLQPTSGPYVLAGITDDLGSLVLEIDRIYSKYSTEVRLLTNDLGKPGTGGKVMARFRSAGQESEQLLKLAQQARRDGELIRAFLDPLWNSEVRQRADRLKRALVTGKTQLEERTIPLTSSRPPTPSQLPIDSVIAEALAKRPKSSAYSAALYPLLIGQIGLGVFLLVAIYRKLVVERLRLKLYESNTENKLAHLGQLAAWLAHEIKQPLTAINAWLWGFQRLVTEDMPEHVGITAIRKEVNRLGQVAKDFIRFTQPAAPKLVSLKPEPVLREILELQGPQLKSRGIQLNLDVPVEALFSADPLQLKQVLLNLVTNAEESIEKDGTITLRARKDKARLNGRSAEVIVLEVEDTGSGIPEEVKQRLFDPFFSTKEEGNGLGLSIARTIIDAHGGVLEFETALGEGSTFRIVLPRVRNGE